MNSPVSASNTANTKPRPICPISAKGPSGMPGRYTARLFPDSTTRQTPRRPEPEPPPDSSTWPSPQSGDNPQRPPRQRASPPSGSCAEAVLLSPARRRTRSAQRNPARPPRRAAHRTARILRADPSARAPLRRVWSGKPHISSQFARIKRDNERSGHRRDPRQNPRASLDPVSTVRSSQAAD